MVELEKSADVEGLKSSVIQLEKTIRSLLRKNAQLQQEILRLKGLDPQQVRLLLEVDMDSTTAESAENEPDATRDEDPATSCARPV